MRTSRIFRQANGNQVPVNILGRVDFFHRFLSRAGTASMTRLYPASPTMTSARRTVVARHAVPDTLRAPLRPAPTPTC